MSQLLTNFIETSQAKVDRSSLKPSEWIARNFRHPRNDRLPWSWEHHEFQPDIVDDESQEKAVIKPAQTGLSTLQIRDILCFLATHDFVKGAYYLPTSAFSREFTQSRFDPAVETSPTVSAMMSTETDNTSIKRIGTNFLILRGTSGTTSAISVDLDLIIVDERDFCNQEVLSSAESRLQHSDLKLRRDFSTPTLPGYGISALYAESSQGVRMVKHDHCGQWVEIEFFNDVVIPGFDAGIAEFRKDHLHLVDVNRAFFRCPHCGHPIKEENLADPDKRQWVDKFPGHFRKGFKVNFFDVVKYNPLHDVLSSVRKYTYSDWVNFRIGAPHESAENSFLTSVIERNTCVTPVSLEDLLAGGYYGLYIGCDLGKVSHLVVGAAHPMGGVDIIHASRIDVTKLPPDSTLGKLLVLLSRAVRSPRAVVDSMPDYSVSLHVAAMGAGFGAVYASNTSLDIYSWDENKGVVRIQRDDHFDDLAAAVNNGRLSFPIGEEGRKIKDHFSVMKKAKVQTSKGIAEKWTSTSDEDHYAHAIGYMWAAYASLNERNVWTPVTLPPSFGKVRLQS